MKLFRFGAPGKEKPGVVNAKGEHCDVSAFGQDFNEEFFNSDGIKRLAEWIRENEKSIAVMNSIERFGPPVARPSKLVCIGLNYSDHAKESNMAEPTEPVVFFKSTSSIVGPNDDLIIPKNSKKTDWEVELGVVIGKKASYIEENEAHHYIAGYVLHNDYSEREFQLERGGQWVKGKSCDTFAPIGPYLVTPDEAGEIGNVRLWLTVNGKMVQDGSTANLVFGVPYLVHYLSQFMTLLPGDIISTGTPAGVGLGQKPEPWYLKPGDVVELGIDGLGTSKQKARSYQPE
jgi:2-keto-4-pentenoate hydratase/2-oxohepta-3-ene-1,7-dioic acid hydratase in catechol pathway